MGCPEQRACRNLRKDQILTHQAIERIPDLERGRKVTIQAGNERLIITAPGRTLVSGSVGEFVKVKNEATGRVIEAEVIDDNTVAMEI